jgi:hypothetical protein
LGAAIALLPDQIDHVPLTFGGKYRGKTPDQIAVKDPGYIVWMSKQDNLCDLVTASLVKACKQDIADARLDRMTDMTGEDDWGDR